MTQWGKIAVLAAVAILFPHLANAGTIIRLSWTETFDRLLPDPQKGIVQTKNMSVTLEDGGAANEATDLQSGKFRTSWHAGAKLGARWKVAGPGTLIRVDSFPNLTTTMKINVSGKSCTFTITHHIKPGAAYFMWPRSSAPGRAGRYTRLEASGATCAIQ